MGVFIQIFIKMKGIIVSVDNFGYMNLQNLETVVVVMLQAIPLQFCHFEGREFLEGLRLMVPRIGDPTHCRRCSVRKYCPTGHTAQL